MKTVYVALFLLTILILTSCLHGVVNDDIPEEKKALMEQYKTDAKSLHESIKSAAKLNSLSRE